MGRGIGLMRLKRHRWILGSFTLAAAAFLLAVPIGCNSGLTLGLQSKVEADDPDDPLLPPENQDRYLTVTSDYHSLDVSWVPSSDDVLEDSQLEYLLAYSLDEADVTGETMLEDAIVALDWTANVSHATITGLDYGEVYHLNVAVRDRAGNKSYYNPTDGPTTPDTDAPVPGGAIAIANTYTDSIEITWSAASDPNGLTSQDDLRYRVVYSDSASIATIADALANGLVATDWASGITGTTIDGLIDAWDYDINVLVRDAEDLTAAYGVVSETTEKQPRLFFSADATNNQRIAVSDLDGGNRADIITTGFESQSEPIDIEVDPVARKIYWVDHKHGTTTGADGAIFRADFDGGNVEAVIASGIPEPWGLAIDYTPPDTWLYWTDVDNDTIYRSELPPSSTAAAGYELLTGTDGLDAPYDIAVDAYTGDIYWVQHGGAAYLYTAIESETTPGSFTMYALVNSGESQPIGITLDPDRGMIYWSSWSVNEVRSHGYSDSLNAITTIAATNVTYPVSLAVDSATGDLFWADGGEQKLYRRPWGSVSVDADDYYLSSLGSLSLPEAVGIY